MSSLPPSPIQNPNSQFPNPNNKKKKKRSRNRNRNKNKKPNWLELPEDAWFLIFSKLVTFDILINVQKVCSLFRKICKQPSIFKSVDMLLPYPYQSEDDPDSVLSMICYAVDCSHGGLVDVFLDYVDFDTIMYLVDRSSNLKHLRLGHNVEISDEELIKAIEKVPTLEEVQLMYKFSSKTVEAVGNICSSLKSFSLVKAVSKSYPTSNEDALAIAKSMPHLRHLQLIGNVMSNDGLKVILDGCTLLECLDLCECFHIDLSGDLGRRCRKIKPTQCRDDSCKDYGRMAYKDMVDFLSTCDEYGDYGYGSDDSYFYDYLDFDDYTNPMMYNEDGDYVGYNYFGGFGLGDYISD